MIDNRTTGSSDVRTTLPGSDGEKKLQKKFETVDRAERFYDTSMKHSLTDRMQEFLQDRRFGTVGVVKKDGYPSVLPRFGNRGSFRVEDEDTVLWAETSVDAIRITDSVIEGRHATVTTVDWWDTTVGLHINGELTVRDESVDRSPRRDGAVSDWVELEVVEAYIHCAKHVPWLTIDSRSSPNSTPTFETGQYDRLTDQLQLFLKDQILAYLGTADGHDETDVSPRLGPRGYIQIKDPSTIAWPEYRGNGIHASLGNVLETNRASLSVFDWWETGMQVEVVGDAVIEDDVPWGTDLTGADRTKSWVVMDVDHVTVDRAHLPTVSVEEFDPPWGTDSAEAKKAGYFS